MNFPLFHNIDFSMILKLFGMFILGVSLKFLFKHAPRFFKSLSRAGTFKASIILIICAFATSARADDLSIMSAAWCVSGLVIGFTTAFILWAVAVGLGYFKGTLQ
jgi:hypothetical protein